MPNAPCLADSDLGDLLAGRVSGDRALQFEGHLAACPQCHTRLAQHRLPVDSLVAAARLAGTSDPLETEPELAAALAAIGRFRSPVGGMSPSGGEASDGTPGIDPTCAAEPEIRNYRLIEKLGEGGMGTVYRAVHVHLEKTVALTIMKADRSGNPQAVSRFEREMKAIGRLEHPHIVRALDAGEEQGVYFLVMEFIAGIDLDQLIRSLGPLPVAEACEIVRQAALGLAHAHQHNLVHRDVKPSNLMLSPEGQVKVLDLGLAQFQQSTGGLELTIEGQMIGTLLYMSPEQLAGAKNVDHRADIFSLGVTLYCLLAGGLPLTRGQPAAMLPDIRSVRGDVPPELAVLVPQLLASTPEDRLGSMAQAAEQLKPLAAGAELVPLVRRARSRPTDRTALPPSLLPSRSPPVHVAAAGAPADAMPAAHIATTRAAHDPTRVAPAKPHRTGSRAVASSPLTGWIAAGLATAALAVVLVFMNRPQPEPAPSLPGTLILAASDPADARLPDYLARQSIRVIDADGDATGLAAGPNELPPGTYRLVADAGELTMPVSQLTIVAGQTQHLALVLPEWVAPPPPEFSLFATIPDVAGPLIRYQVELWHSGLPDDQRTTYELTLRAKDDEAIGKVQYRWIEVEVVTHASHGDYTEKALLLVDRDRYESEQYLDVKQGWITAESESLKQRLAKQFPDKAIELLAVEYDRNDVLAARAKDLNLYVPVERLSVQQGLVLLFGAAIPTAPEPLRKSRALAANDSRRIQERVLLANGSFCDVIRSGPIEELEKSGTKGYLIAVNPNVSFGLERLFVFSDELHLKCSRLYSNDKAAPSRPDKDFLAEQTVRVAALPKQKLDPIGISLLPPADGALASYAGELVRGNLPKIAFDAHVRTAGSEVVDGVTLQALEVRAVTHASDSQPEHVELAWLRVDANRYQQEKFVIHDGWFRAHGETFPFDPQGALLPVEDELLALGRRIPFNRLGVHDVLGLLFDAKLEASSTGSLRGTVQTILATTGQQSIQSETQAPLRGKPSVTADLWTFPKREGCPLDYVICRSASLPFDFYTVNLNLAHPTSGFSIITALTNYETSGSESLLGDPQALRLAALATNQKVQDKLRNPNVRVWRTAKDALFGEFAGTAPMSDGLRRRPAVFIWPPGAKSIADTHWWFLDELRKSDQEWVAAGRFWSDGQRFEYERRFGIERRWTVRRKSGTRQEDRPYEGFAPVDRDWIDRQEDLRRWADVQNSRKK
jgi:serine/threonine protein kinase